MLLFWILIFFGSFYLPVVEVEESRSLTAREDEIKVVDAIHVLVDSGIEGLPTAPSSSMPNFETGDHLAFQAVKTHLYSSAAQTTGNNGSEVAWCLLAEIH